MPVRVGKEILQGAEDAPEGVLEAVDHLAACGEPGVEGADLRLAIAVEREAVGAALLLFGRVTYEVMAGFWPSPEALKSDPVVAQGMNSSPKIVFYRTLKKAEWANTRLVKNDMLGEVRRLKEQPGKDLVVLGSGSLVAQLAQAGLIDEYQILLNPVVLGKGKTMFEGVKGRFNLKLTSTRSFGNGNVLLTYERKA